MKDHAENFVQELMKSHHEKWDDFKFMQIINDKITQKIHVIIDPTPSCEIEN